MSASLNLLKELVEKNRSYRKFVHSHKLSETELLQMVDTARLAPSSKNRQPLKYLLAYNATDTTAVFAHLKWAWYLKDWNGPSPEDRPAAYIVMLLDKNINDRADVDVGIAAQTILLAATEMGYGACIVRTVNYYEITKYFQLPPSLEIMLVIALGKPAQQIVIDEIETGQGIEYYEDTDNNHHVPKRKLADIIWNPKSRR